MNFFASIFRVESFTLPFLLYPGDGGNIFFRNYKFQKAVIFIDIAEGTSNLTASIDFGGDTNIFSISPHTERSGRI
jgi:hypothetical protein